MFNGHNKTLSANLNISNPFNLTKSPWNFDFQYKGPQINVTDNFIVSNSVSAPANAMASNSNSDNDMITNAATNLGGRRKKRKAPTINHHPVYNEILLSDKIKPTKVSNVNYSESKVFNSIKSNPS